MSAMAATAEIATARPVRQLTVRQVLAVWAAAALPMAALAWIVTPLVADGLDGPAPLSRVLIVAMTVGLVWQGALVAILVRREQGTLRWAVLRDALWLRSPVDPKTGRRGGRVWLVLIPLILLFGVEELLPSFPAPPARDLAAALDSSAGHAIFGGSWAWFAVVVVMVLFNTVLGEELLFRGYLLPRMADAFGRADWFANGVLFALYHLHMPWAIPWTVLDAFLLAWPTKRYRSAWIGIVVHSTQSLVILGAVLAVVLGG